MRVLRVVTRPNLGGPMRQAVALWHAQRALGVRTVLAVGRCEAGETGLDLDATGIPVLSAAELAGRGSAAEGLWVVTHLGRRLAPWRDLRAARSLRRLCDVFRPDVVHTHTSKAGVLGRSAARARGVRVVAHTYHGLILRDYSAAPLAEIARRLERRWARRSDLLFAVSESCRDELRELGVAPDVRVVPPAVDTTAFAAADRQSARRRLGVGPGTVALGFVGRLVPVKEPGQFLSLIAALPEHVVGFVFGDGPLAGRLAGVRAPRVRLLGAVEELAASVAGLDLLVMPSRREGFPIAGIEAAAAGVPTLGYDVPGVRDLALATRPELLVPREAGIAGLIERARALLAGPLPRLGAAGTQLAQRCDPAAVARILTDAYRDVLAEHGS